MADVTDEYIELRGLRFHFRQWPGPGMESPVLVMLHGYTSHARSWDFVAGQLSHRYSVLALDQRGHGESQWDPAGNYDTHEMVADLGAFVAAMGLREFTLLGLSMGGIVAFAYAGTKPPELARLVIVDIGPEVNPAGLQKIRANVANTDVFPDRESAFRQARATNPVPSDERLRERVNNNLMRTEDGNWTYRYDRVLRTGTRESIPPDEAWQLVSNIEVPTLLVRGAASDILARDVAERMVDSIPDCRLEEIAGAGHPVPLDQPEAFLAAVERFL